MEQTSSPEQVDTGVRFRFQRPTQRQMSIGVGVIVILGALFYARGFLIAATVNGEIVSRWSVIRELEQRSGSQALESMVTKKIIEMELERLGVEVSSEEIDAAIEGIRSRVVAQGGVFEEALKEQGLSEAAFREQVIIQKKVEKILADQTVVTDADVASYMKENKITVPKDTSEDDFKKQIKDQLKQEKFQEVSREWVAGLNASATVKRYQAY